MQDWKINVDYPDWMVEEGLKTLQKQHLLDNETPKEMYLRIVNTLKEFLPVEYKEQIATKWFDYLWKGWLSPSTPILANCGTDRGYTISCYVERVKDSMDSIYQKIHELALLTKGGGGVGITFDKVRGRGEKIAIGGFSEGIIPFVKVYDSAIIAANQSNVRRGSASINLPVRHKDIDEFLRMRLPEGDVNRQCLNLNHCVTIDDYFMQSVLDGDIKSRETYAAILTSRMKTGQPYIMYYHNVHRQRPEDMVKRNLKIDGTNLCSEILLPHDENHTVVCDLASVNMVKYTEWKNDVDFIEFSLLLLDCNLSEYIKQAKNKIGFENAIRFAEKSRAVGLGILGWATFLQENNQSFISLFARHKLKELGQKLELEGLAYNKKWGKLLGTPEWCTENRNLTLFAVAPTTTTSLIMGGVSQGIEPIIANAWVQKSAKGTFIRKNKQLENLIREKYSEHNTDTFWSDLMSNKKGSIQNYSFFTPEEKEVFLTAYEINQLELVKQASILQKYIDQGISLNLFFPADVETKWLSKVHLTAWEEGLKTLYYLRTESITSRQMTQNTFSDCYFCEG